MIRTAEDRKVGSRRLLAEAERYRQLVETSKFIPWEMDLATWRFTYVGPQAAEVLGYPIDDWYGPEFWPDHIHPDDRDEAVSFCASRARAGEDHEFEYRMIAADGHPVWIRDLVSVILSDDGAPVGLRGVMLKVDAEKAAQQASRLSEQRFRDFAEASSDWFWETDETHAYTWISDVTKGKIGLVPEWFLGRRRVEISDIALDPEAWAEHERRLAAHEPYRDLVLRVRWPDGDRWVRSNGVPIFDETGRFRGYRGSGSDVTAQVEAERKIKRTLELFESAINSMADGFALFDAEDRFVTCNEPYRAFVETYSVDLKPGLAFESIVRAGMEHGRIRSATDDPERWIRWRMEQHRNPKGPFVVEGEGWSNRVRESRTPDGSTVVIITDITAQVAAERETRRTLELFKTAIESIPDGFSLYDADDRFVTCNGVTLQLMGDTAAMAQPGTPFEDIVRSAVDAGFVPAAADDPDGYVRQRMEQHRNPAGPFEVEDTHRWLRIHESRTPDGGTVIIHTDITARVAAEHETRRTLDLFESAIESIPDGFSLYDADDRFVVCNSETLRIMGETAHLAKPGTPFETIVSAAVQAGYVLSAVDDPEGYVRRRMERHRNPAGPFEVEDTNRWVRIHESRMPDGGTVIIHTDVTDRVTAELETKRTLALFESAIGSIPDGFALFDAEDRFVTCNEPYRKYCGEAAVAIKMGQRFEAFIRSAVEFGLIPDAAEDPEEWIRQRMEMHRNPKGPFELERKDGWLRIQESRMPDGGTVIILTDITARVGAERETQRALALFKSAIDSIPDGFALFDAEDRFVTCNEPYRKPRGEPEAHIEPGATFESLIRDAVKAGLIPGAEGDPEGWIRHRMEMHRNPKGPFELERTNRWLRIQESRTPDGGTVIVLTDITLEKQREEQLRQTQKMDALGKLTGGLAHDFNNLLAVIAGNIELVAEELGDRPDLLGMTQAAIRASERGATLTRSLLAFARQQPQRLGEVDLNHLVGDMSELIRRTIPENIAVRVVPGEGVWHCAADAGLLQNALLNLVVNARDAMPRGGTLTIGTAAERIDEEAAARNGVKPGDYAILAVTDTGTGMAPEVVERAFEPFFTMKPVGKGTGLGLSMVYGFARQSGGHAGITSTLGRGTTLRLWLPRWRPEAVVSEQGARVRRAGGGEKVLVVEDDPDLLVLVAGQLESLGYRVVQAVDGTAGLGQIARHDDLAVLLTDVVLAGGINGSDLARRALSVRPALRIVLMSGYMEEAVRRDDLVGGGAKLLQKPFTRTQLSAVLRDVLDGAASPPGQGPTRGGGS